MRAAIQDLKIGIWNLGLLGLLGLLWLCMLSTHLEFFMRQPTHPRHS